MSGCLDCGRPCQGARCKHCGVEHGAPEYDYDPDDEVWQTYDCPTCDGETRTEGESCYYCRHLEDRAEQIAGDLDRHDEELAGITGESSD